ncbi:unnamed protein product [Brachionus calyciflorus]|uniref:Transmembrane protein 47 n=1 Tax=Brachionus calyciflorus TaxID=104777 RepID=A0A813M3B6_9BILA|nr:unnamed protein product [Brachionus calyciflorus]
MGAPTAKLETIVITSPFKINAFVFALITCFLLLVCLFTDNWLTATDIKQGLWRNCTLASSIPSLAYSIQANKNINHNDFYICAPLNILWVQLCGSFIVVSFCCTIIGLVLIIMGLKHKKRQERKMKFYGAAAFVFFVGVICILTTLIMFPLMFIKELHERGRDKWYFGWSYGVAWGAVFFLADAVILLLCDRKKEELFYKESLYLNNDEEDIIDRQEAKIKTLKR